MICPKCGFENVENSNYCINCGSRLDGKVRCPKCGEFLESDSEKCPSCGFVVPHKHEQSSHGFNDKRQKIKNVFTRIFAIVSIVLFALAIVECFGFYLKASSTSETDFWDGSAIYYLVINIFNCVKSLQTSLSPSEFSAMLISAVIPFLIVILNISVVITASIIGIIKSIKNLKNRTYNTHQFLMIVMLSNLVSTILLYAFSSSYGYGQEYLTYEISSSKTSLITNICINLFIMFVSESFFEFSKNAKMTFIVRILLSFVFGGGIILLSSFHDNFINLFFSEDVRYSYGFASFLVNRIAEVGNGGSSNIALLVLSISYFVLIMILIILLVSSILFTSLHYFNNTYRKHSYYIPMYALTITILIVTVLSLIVHISIHTLLMGVGYKEVTSSYSIYVLAILYAGFPFSSTMLIRKINQNTKLAEQTSVIESDQHGRD